MGTKSSTTIVSVDSAAKVTLLSASAIRRSWSIYNPATVALNLFFDSDTDLGFQVPPGNTLVSEPMGDFTGKIEGQMASGGAISLSVTEFL